MYIHWTIWPPLYIDFTCGGRDSRERDSVSSTLATGKGGDPKSDVPVQAYSAGACVYSTPTAEAGTYLSGFTDSIGSSPELAFYGRGPSTFYGAQERELGDSSVALSSRSFWTRGAASTASRVELSQPGEADLPSYCLLLSFYGLVLVSSVDVYVEIHV